MNQDLTYPSVAETILTQLGGSRRLGAMIGAYNFLDLDGGIQFRFKGSQTANCIRVKLNGRDTYDVEFFRIKGLDFTITSTHMDVHVEELAGLFVDKTGLHLSL